MPKEENQINTHFQLFLQNHWEVYKHEIVGNEYSFKEATLAIKVFSMHNLFLKFFPKHLLQLIVDLVNENITKRNTKRKTQMKAFNISEYFLYMKTKILLQIYKVHDVGESLQVIKKISEYELMEENRFFNIQSCLSFETKDLRKISQTFSEISCSHISSLSYVVIDESMYKYQFSASMKELSIIVDTIIPPQYIPRKPHPNGMLCYLTGTYIKAPNYSKKLHLPYIIFWDPLLQRAQASLTDTVRRSIYFFQNINRNFKPAIIADSAFSDDQIYNDLNLLQWRYIFSTPSSENKFLWNTLKHGLENKKFRAAFNKKKNQLAHIGRIETQASKFEYKCIFTNIFSLTQEIIQTNSPITLSDVELIYSFGEAKLKEIAKNCSLSLVGGIKGIIEQMIGYPVPPQEDPNPSTTKKHKGSNPSETFNKRDSYFMQIDPEQEAEFDVLWELKGESFKETKKSYGISTNIKKGEAILRILEIQKIKCNEMTTLESDLSAFTKNQSDIQKDYRTLFNVIDTHDGYVYDKRYSFRIMDHRVVYFTFLFESYLMNLYSAFSSSNDKTKIDFLKDLINFLDKETPQSLYH